MTQHYYENCEDLNDIEYTLKLYNSLSGSINLLEHTSQLVIFFRTDRRPLKEAQDLLRLEPIMAANTWFTEWEKGVQKADWPNKCLITWGTRDDIKSCIIGFVRLVKLRFDLAPGTSITPTFINSDIIENIFCQYRATYNGPGTNPPYRIVQKLATTVTLEQSTVSRRSNTGRAYATQT